MHAHVRELARHRAGRDPVPSAASQPVKTHLGGLRGFERLPVSSEALVYLMSMRLLLARLA